MTGYFFQSNVVSDMNVHWVNSGLFILDGHNYLHLMTIKGFNTSHRCLSVEGHNQCRWRVSRKQTKNPAFAVGTLSPKLEKLNDEKKKKKDKQLREFLNPFSNHNFSVCSSRMTELDQRGKVTYL